MWIDGTVSNSDRMFYAGTAGHHQHHSTLKANESESFSGQRAVVHLNVTLPRSHLTCLNCHNKCKTSRPVPTAVLSAEEKEGELFPDRPRPFISARLFVRLQYCMVVVNRSCHFHSVTNSHSPTNNARNQSIWRAR